MLKKWRNAKIIERNRADFIRFGHLRSKAHSEPIMGLPSFHDAEQGEGSENGSTAVLRRGFFGGSDDFSYDLPPDGPNLLFKLLLIYFRLS